MASILQIQANRRNSQKSTGPRTDAGKATSSMNAFKSGIDAKSEIIRGEDPEQLELLKTSYYESLQPAGPEEVALVDSIIAADWLLRRLRKLEAETWNDAFHKQELYEKNNNEPEQEYRLATAFLDRGATFARLQRRLDAAHRSLHRSLTELRRLRESNPTPEPPPEDARALGGPVLVSPSPEKPPVEIGFVPSNRSKPVLAAPDFAEPAQPLRLIPRAPSPGPRPLSTSSHPPLVPSPCPVPEVHTCRPPHSLFPAC